MVGGSLLPGRVGITGGTGFIGRGIAKRLLDEGIPQVVILSRTGQLPPALEGNSRAEAVVCDIRDFDAVRKALKGCDAVFHQAALRTSQCLSEPRAAYATMVNGTLNVLAACTALGVRKVVAASSSIVYGEGVLLPMSESHPLRPTTPYGVAKVQNESLLEAYRRYFGLNFTVLRYFDVYGPGMTPFGSEAETLIRWLDRLDADLPPLIFGDGRQSFDWVFVDDVVEANWRALLYPESGGIFNVCSGEAIAHRDLSEMLCRIMGKKIRPELRPARAGVPVSRRLGDPLEAERVLGFRARTALTEGLKRLVEWRNRLLAKRTAFWGPLQVRSAAR